MARPARRHRIAPFTLRNIKEDLEDLGSRFDGAPDLEFRSATAALELEKSGLSYQRVPPGYRFPYGRTHKKQEEVYVVLRGSGRMKVDDAADVADRAGISRGTARRYLEFLASSGSLELTFRYGSTGRPEHLYRPVAPTPRT